MDGHPGKNPGEHQIPLALSCMPFSIQRSNGQKGDVGQEIHPSAISRALWVL